MPRAVTACLVVIVAWALPVRAQEDDDLCEPPPEGVDQTFPADRATQVPLDAAIRVRYGASPPRDAENVIRVRHATTDRDVAGIGQRAGREIVFVPSVPLTANTEYEVVAPDPLVGDRTSTFTTGSRMDAGPPDFGALREVTSEVVNRPACGAPDGGYRITATFDPAIDDGAPEDIEYVVYQTRGPGIVEPLERARVRGLTSEQQFAAFLLPADDAVGPICLNAFAYDGNGAAGGTGRERCLDPVQGNYFASCSAAGGGARAGSGLLALVAAAALAMARRRRGRTRRKAASRLNP